MVDRFKQTVERVRKLKFSRRLVFYLLGVVMVVAVGGIIVWMATFLAERLNTALTTDPNLVTHTQFDIQGFEKLQLTK